MPDPKNIGITSSSSSILNADLKWEQVDSAARDAFRAGAEKVQLRAGFHLYKFTDEHGFIEPGARVSPWWSPQEAFHDDPGMNERLHLAQVLHVSPAELARVVAAVRANWNAMTRLVTVSLLKDVWAFWGKAGWQPRSGNESIARLRDFDGLVEKFEGVKPHRAGFPGTVGQFYIPGLIGGEHVAELAFVTVEELMKGRGVGV